MSEHAGCVSALLLSDDNPAVDPMAQLANILCAHFGTACPITAACLAGAASIAKQTDITEDEFIALCRVAYEEAEA